MKRIALLILAIMILISARVSAEIYGSISGKVTLENGLPLEGVFTKIKNYKDSNDKKLLGNKALDKYSTSDKNGIINFNILTYGKYYLEVISLPEPYKELYKAKIPSMPIELPQGQNIIDLNIKVSRYYGTISGRVFREDGVTPFENVYVNLSKKGWALSCFSKDSNYRLKYEPNNDLWKIIVETLPTSNELGKFYISDSTLNLSKLEDIEMNVVFNSENITGFYGALKNPDETIFTEGNSITVKSDTFDFSATAYITNGNYQIKGLIPGEYKFSIFVGNIEFDSTQGLKAKIKKILIDSTYTILTLGEQKQIDFICDKNKIKIIEDVISPIYAH